MDLLKEIQKESIMGLMLHYICIAYDVRIFLKTNVMYRPATSQQSGEN